MIKLLVTLHASITGRYILETEIKQMITFSFMVDILPWWSR